MNIWADANGWPIPPTVLLGCLVAEILYFRGWRVLVKAEQARAARAMTHPAFNGSHAVDTVGQLALARHLLPWRDLCYPTRRFCPHRYTLQPALLGSYDPAPAYTGRHGPAARGRAPLLPLWLGLPRRARRLLKACVKLKARLAFYRMGHWLRQPAVSCGLLIVGTWAWHWPALYDLALTNAAIHDWCEHATFLAVSALFWTQVIPSPPLRPRLGYLGRVGCVGIAIIQNVVLAVLIGFAQVPLYAPYAHLALAPGGLSALQDQQLGAGIMWTFGDFPFGIAFAVLVHGWLVSQSDDQGEVNIVEKQSA